MSDSRKKQWNRPAGTRDSARAERLAAELRKNLKKRKKQARQRAVSEVADAPPATDDPISPA